MTVESSRWANKRRLEFGELIGMSVPQASLDLARYHLLAPPSINRDREQRPNKQRRIFGCYFRSYSLRTAQQFQTADLKAVNEHNQVQPEGVDHRLDPTDDGRSE